MRIIRLLFFLGLMIIPLLTIIKPAAGEGNGKTVYVIPVQQEIERGLEAFLERTIDDAEKAGADHIIFEINTPGGRVDSANKIAQLIRNTKIPTTAYIIKDAFSAGAYIALNANEIVMKPSTMMGSAAVINAQGNTAGKKAESAWIAEMEAAAELNNRDPKYARAMADENIEIKELGLEKGKLLTLTANQALKVGYAENIVDDRQELLSYLKLDDAKVTEVNLSLAEKVARVVTSPIVVAILFSIGFLGLAIELFTPGFGIAGTIGLLSLSLYFFGHMIAGLAGWESIALFVLGLVFLFLEIFVPGGIIGLLGVIAVIAGLVMAAGSVTTVAISIGIAVVVTVIGSFIFLKYFGYRGPLRKLILFDSTSTEKGYVSNDQRADLTGRIAESITPLRPSGTAELDGEYLDVVTEGSFIQKGKKLKIVKVQGSRIVVREVKEDVLEKGGD
ncbi:nodulation protein NfeD [Fictibacillus sp. NE201]|uniref:Nodulation protein NfeD n=1 Tax=Fictibacillus fluitans TaxID=3058422 RepID=A0ABT8HY96_9BACL|nr:nodulation protein NfeD [Fictibacillus sp. NE201]MDN4525440.1 nodulation protein NfeD [Fictibacillus sp. NE201]